LMSALVVLVAAIISIKWKISLHMTAQGALAGMLLAIAFRHNANLLLFISMVFFGGGLVGWARLYLRAHTPAQVYIGYCTGLALAFLVLYRF
jgi:membrane-associated phospholipid phosphatase